MTHDELRARWRQWARDYRDAPAFAREAVARAILDEVCSADADDIAIQSYGLGCIDALRRLIEVEIN